jgi:hypothetical protein
MVTLAGEEFYCEIDPESEVGKRRLAVTPWDVREVVLEHLGLIPAAKCESDWMLGSRAGEWLQVQAGSNMSGGVELLYDYDTDLELLVGALQECNLWPTVRLIAREQNIGGLTGALGPDLASEAIYGQLRRRKPSLVRHHALADAHALRGAWRVGQLVRAHPLNFRRLLRVAGPSREGWLYEWLVVPEKALDGRAPIDVLDDCDGMQTVEAYLSQLADRPSAP